MAWAKREPVTNLVVLGDGEDNRRKIGGLLAGTPRDRMYPEKVNYLIVQKDGEEMVLSGSASLGRQIADSDIGKFITCEFTGWGKSANGRFKMIDVNVWEGELTDAMKKWPRFAEFSTKTQAQKKAAANGKNAPPDADDFGEDRGPEEDYDDGRSEEDYGF